MRLAEEYVFTYPKTSNYIEILVSDDLDHGGSISLFIKRGFPRTSCVTLRSYQTRNLRGLMVIAVAQ